MNGNWNEVSATVESGKWDKYLAPEVRDAERTKIRKMTDAKLIDYYTTTEIAPFKKSAFWEIVMVRRLMTKAEAHALLAK